MRDIRRIPITGVPLRCPDCRRLLVDFHKDGTAHVARMTLLRGSIGGEVDDDGFFGEPDEAIVTDAICMMPRCRLRRRLAPLMRRIKSTRKGRERR